MTDTWLTLRLRVDTEQVDEVDEAVKRASDALRDVAVVGGTVEASVEPVTEQHYRLAQFLDQIPDIDAGISIGLDSPSTVDRNPTGAASPDFDG